MKGTEVKGSGKFTKGSNGGRASATGRVLSVWASGKSGWAGKTTVATNLAGCLHTRGHLALLVVSDPQCTALDWYSAQPDWADLPAVIGIDRPVLHKSIPQFTGDYAHIVIDGSPRIAENTTSAIRVADLVLIPVRYSGFDLWAVESLVEATPFLGPSQGILDLLGRTLGRNQIYIPGNGRFTAYNIRF